MSIVRMIHYLYNVEYNEYILLLFLQESEIKLCGNCGRAYLSVSVLVFCILVWNFSDTLAQSWS